MSEAFSNVAVLYLISLPLAMATIGWVAATATARIRYVDLVQQNQDSVSTPKATGRIAEGSQRRTIGFLLLSAVVAVAIVIAVLLLFLAR